MRHLLSAAALLLLPAVVPAQQREATPDTSTMDRPINQRAVSGLKLWGEVASVFAHQLYNTSEGETEANVGATVRGAAEYRLRAGFSPFVRVGVSLARVWSRRGSIDLERFGNGWQYDLMAGMSWRPPIGRPDARPIALHAAAGGAWITGSEEVIPYPTIEEQDQPFGIWEAGVSMRINEKPLEATVAFQTLRVLPKDVDGSVQTRRFIAGLRIGS